VSENGKIVFLIERLSNYMLVWDEDTGSYFDKTDDFIEINRYSFFQITCQ